MTAKAMEDDLGTFIRNKSAREAVGTEVREEGIPARFKPQDGHGMDTFWLYEQKRKAES